MKRLLALVMCVCLSLGAFSAQAAQGDKMVLRNGQDGVESISLLSVAYLDGTLYMMCRDKLYTYDGELGAYEYKAPVINQGGNASVTSIMLDGDTVRALVSEYVTEAETRQLKALTLYALDIAPDGAVMFGDPLALDYMELMDYTDDNPYLRNIYNPFIQDGRMVFTAYTNYGSVVMAYDLSMHKAEEFFVESPESITPYKLSEILVISNDYGKNPVLTRFCALDIDTGDTRDLFEIEAPGFNTPTGAVYDARNDYLYYLLDGELFRVENMNPATIMNVNAVSIESGFRSPVLTDDGFYVACDYNTVAIFNTDPNARADKRLVVQNAYMQQVDNACYQFADAHPDTEVRLTDLNTDILQALLTRDSGVDIFALDSGSVNYASMYARGYLGELTDSPKLAEYVADMYPAIKSVIMKDGELLAIPIEQYSSESLGMNNDAMKALGLTPDDVPATWTELFDFLKTYPALAEAHPEVSLFDAYDNRLSVEYKLHTRLWREYLIYLQKQPGAELSFDTPAFRELLKGLSEIDYEALNVPEEIKYADDFSIANAPRFFLIEQYADITAYATNFVRLTPMPLVFAQGDEPVIKSQLKLLAVNPYSQNRELAMEFLETVIDNVPAITLTHLNVNRDEPIENANYEFSIQKYNDSLNATIAALEQADEADKLRYQERIEVLNETIELYQNEYKYDASPRSIAFYRDYAKYMLPGGYAVVSNDYVMEVNSLFRRYIEGAIDMDALIKEIDGKLRMMLLEGN